MSGGARGNMPVAGLVIPAVIAHRGASVGYPENTLAAFEAAVEMGADMLEMDVRLTADCVPVVIHDPTVTLCSGKSVLVSDMTLRDIRAQPALADVAMLSDVLDTVASRCAVELEIKHLADEPGTHGLGPVAAATVAQLLTEIGFDAALVSCFELPTLDQLRRAAPEIATGLECEGHEGLGAAIDACVRNGHPFVLPDVETILSDGARVVERAHRHGLFVATWVADDVDVIDRLFDIGVDAVESNDVAVAIKARDRARAIR